jgi:hypothetical protein
MSEKYERYPHISLLESINPNPRILLGQRLFWTEKKDGSNVNMWFEYKGQDMYAVDGTTGEQLGVSSRKLNISSRNQKNASSDIQALVKRCEDYPKILELLNENPQFQVYFEACKKGRSVTGAEIYDKDFIIVFDIYDRESKKFLNYVNVHQHCYHHGIAVVKLWAETQHATIEELMNMKEQALDYCKQAKLEGIVIKAYRLPPKCEEYYIENFDGLIQAKIKLDIPKPVKIVKDYGIPQYPPMPDSEAMGTIDKVWQDIGTEEFMKTSVAMPMIALEIGRACSEHLYSKPKSSFFKLYQEYQKKLINGE